MFDYLVVGANNNSFAFVNAILRLTLKTVLLVDDKVTPIEKSKLNYLHQFTNFFHIFCYDISKIEELPYSILVNAMYDGPPKLIFEKFSIVLQPILLDESRDAEIIGIKEALGEDIKLDPLEKNWKKYTTSYLNLLKLKMSINYDIYFTELHKK